MRAVRTGLFDMQRLACDVFKLFIDSFENLKKWVGVFYICPRTAQGALSMRLKKS
jgi:hypothetical protein